MVSGFLCVQQGNIAGATGNTHYSLLQIGKHLKSLRFDTRPLQQLCWWLKSLLNEQVLSIICQLGSQRKTGLIYTGAFKDTVSPYTTWPWRAKECLNNSLMERISKCAERHPARGSMHRWCGQRAQDLSLMLQIWIAERFFQYKHVNW